MNKKLYYQDVLNTFYEFATKSKMLDLLKESDYISAAPYYDALQHNRITSEKDLPGELKEILELLKDNLKEKIDYDKYMYHGSFEVQNSLDGWKNGAAFNFQIIENKVKFSLEFLQLDKYFPDIKDLILNKFNMSIDRASIIKDGIKVKDCNKKEHEISLTIFRSKKLGDE